MRKFTCGLLFMVMLIGMLSGFTASAADSNISQNAVATASSFNPDFSPEKGVDGVTSGDESKFQAGNRQWPQSYKLDLGDVYNISGFQIYWARRIITYKYTLEISDDDVNYTLVKDERYRNEANNAGGLYERFSLKTSGRYVRLTCYGCFNGEAAEGDFSFFEFVVTGSMVISSRNPVNAVSAASPPPTQEPQKGEVRDLAMGKTAEASSFKTEYPPEEAVSLASAGGRFEAENRQFPQWYKVDLGEICNIQSFEIYWFRRVLTYNYQLEISDDDRNYTLIKDSRYITEANTLGDAAERFNLITSGRYLRITCYGCYMEGEPQGDFAFSRFAVMGVPLDGGARNPVNKIEPAAAPTPEPRVPGQPYAVSFNKAVTASSTNPAYPVENGVDWDTASRWQAGNRQLPHWYKIDLGQICDISSFEIFWYRKGLVYRYTIEVSNDDKTWTVVKDDKLRMTPNIESGNSEKIEAVTRGRYCKLTCYACFIVKEDGSIEAQGDFTFGEFKVMGEESDNQDVTLRPQAGTGAKALECSIKKTDGTENVEINVNPAGNGYSAIPKQLYAIVYGSDSGGRIQDIQIIPVDLDYVNKSVNLPFENKDNLSYKAVIWDKANGLYE